MTESRNQAVGDMLDAMSIASDAVAAFVGVRKQFEDAGWPREMANQIVADLIHQNAHGSAS